MQKIFGVLFALLLALSLLPLQRLMAEEKLPILDEADVCMVESDQVHTCHVRRVTAHRQHSSYIGFVLARN